MKLHELVRSRKNLVKADLKGAKMKNRPIPSEQVGVRGNGRNVSIQQSNASSEIM